MEILRKDKSVKKGSEFYVKRNGVPISKKEVLEMKTIEFDPFVLGILHYVIKTHPENTKGKSLIEALVNEPTKKSTRKKFVIERLKPEDVAINGNYKDVPADVPSDDGPVSTSTEKSDTPETLPALPKQNEHPQNKPDDTTISRHTYKKYSLEAMIQNIKAPSAAFPYVCLTALPSPFKCVNLNTEPDKLKNSSANNIVYGLSADFDFKPDYSS